MDIKINYRDGYLRYSPYALHINAVDEDETGDCYWNILRAKDAKEMHDAILTFLNSRYFVYRIDLNWEPREYIHDNDSEFEDDNPIDIAEYIYHWCRNADSIFVSPIYRTDGNASVFYEAYDKGRKHSYSSILITFDAGEHSAYLSPQE